MLRVKIIMRLGLIVGLGLPAQAGRVLDNISNISFVPPPYFQTTPVPKAKLVHFTLIPPDKHTRITTGALTDRKVTIVTPMNPVELKTLCTKVQTLIPQGLTLTLSKRFLIDGKNGAECQFGQPSGRFIRWIGIPEAGQLVFFFADWPKSPTTEQINLFRQFIGSIQIF